MAEILACFPYSTVAGQLCLSVVRRFRERRAVQTAYRVAVPPGNLLNVAVTLLALVMFTTQVDAPPVQAPDQPVKTDPALGAAVKVTLDPSVKLALQTDPHARPPGLLVTGPLPLPDLVTVKVWPARLNVAVAFFAVVAVSVQAPVPEQDPAHPAKTDPAAGEGVSVTSAP
jgi:hypothetical protein